MIVHRAHRTPVRLTLAAALAALALAGCGGGGSGDGTAGGTDDEASGPTRTVKLGSTAVTFPEPLDAGLRRAHPEPPNPEVVVATGIDGVNLVFVHRLPGRAPSLRGLTAAIDTTLVGFGGETKEEHSGLPMVDIAFEHPVPDADARSDNWFFVVDEVAWQVECQYTAAHREAIEEACAEVIDGVEVGAEK